MYLRQISQIASVALGSVLVALAAAVPAHATATFPDTDGMYVIGCGKNVQSGGQYSTYYNDGSTPLNTIQLFSVDPTSAEATPIGNGTGSNVTSGQPYSYTCESEPAWDPTTNTAYFRAQINDGSTSYDALMSMDLATGVATEIAPFTGFSSAPAGCGSGYQGMAIADDGTAYVYDSNSCLHSLNLETAEVTYIGGVENANNGRYYAQAWSLDPATQVWQVLEMYDGFLSSADTSTGMLSDSGPTVTFDESYDPQSLEFDSNGQGWAINVAFNIGTMTSTSYLYSLDAASGSVTKVGTTRTVADGDFYTEALLVTRPVAGPTPSTPTLPETGIDARAFSTIAMVGVMAMIGGLAVLMRRRGAASS